MGAEYEFAAGRPAAFPRDRVAVGGVEFGQQQRGVAAQYFRSFGDGHTGQLQVEAGPLGLGRGVGQLGEGVANDPNVFGTDESVPGGGTGFGQRGLLTGQVGGRRDTRSGFG
ncbi:MAG: hypothetical protein QOH27_3259, partial [Mycobacterium sp.]|nr:hypothetical protein [Mycobacterium sp.]